MWGYDAAGTEVNQLAARELVLSNQQRYSSILRRGLSSKSREFVQKVLEGMQHDKKGTLPVCAGSVLDLLYGNTAQFPPCGLSTAPAAAARHLRCQNAR